MLSITPTVRILSRLPWLSAQLLYARSWCCAQILYLALKMSMKLFNRLETFENQSIFPKKLILLASVEQFDIATLDLWLFVTAISYIWRTALPVDKTCISGLLPSFMSPACPLEAFECLTPAVNHFLASAAFFFCSDLHFQNVDRSSVSSWQGHVTAYWINGVSVIASLLKPYYLEKHSIKCELMLYKNHIIDLPPWKYSCLHFTCIFKS